jgi:DNA-binding SARP family transcriptional activator
MAAQPRSWTAQSGVGCTVHLLGDLRVDMDGAVPAVPEGSKRLLVFLALHHRRVGRKWVAALLWPDCNDERAAGNLRSSLWRLRGAGIGVLQADKWSICLADGVTIDVDLVDQWAGRVIGGRLRDDDLQINPWCVDALDLLPGWYEDWVIMTRERLRHRVLHALEAVSRRLSVARRHDQAVEAAMLAARAEPFRDSAQRALIAAHLAEGNWIEGQRSCRVYLDMLRRDLGVGPPSDLADFVARPWHFTGAGQPAESLVVR